MSEMGIAKTEAAAAASEPIFRLIYRSHSLVPAAAQDGELGNILRVARANNGARGITGALLVYENWFAQTLEGPEALVRELFSKIKRDKRHDTVEVRSEGVAEARVFSRWAMARVAEHGDPDIPLIATTGGVAVAASRTSTPDQESVLDIMRDATRGYGRGY